MINLHQGDINIPYFRMDEPLALQVGHFVDCIFGRKRFLSDGHNKLEVARILETIAASLKTGQLQQI